MTTQAQRDEIVARAAKIASIGGGLLANASLLKKAAVALTVDDAPPTDPVPDPPTDPEPDPPATPPGSVGVAGGWDVTQANTGALAYVDPSLGRAVTMADLTASKASRASDLADPGGTITRMILDVPMFTVDIPCTIVGVYAKGSIAGASGVTWDISYSTADCTTGDTWQADTAFGGGNFTATRCQFFGGRGDGVRGSSGRQSLVECWVRTRGVSGSHSDGYQFYDPSAKTSDAFSMLRCNVDARPTSGLGAANAAFFAADSTTLGTFEVRDNLLRGGTYVVRCNDSGTYTVTGNRIVVDAGGYPAMRYGQAVIAQWSGNVQVDEAGQVLAAVPDPQ